MESIFAITKSITSGLRRDMRVRLGVGAGASVLLSAGVLGLGGSFTPEFLHASAPLEHSVIPQERLEVQGLVVVDMSTSTVFQIIESLPKAARFELMLYNSGAEQALKRAGTYTVFVPSSAKFDYLPKRYLASLSRTEASQLALSHMAARALPLQESLSGTVVTLGNTAYSFEVEASGEAATVGGANIVHAYKASNGYVYIIDKVLVDAN